MASVPLPSGKDLLLSRSFWGAVMLLVGVVLKAAGHEFDTQEATDRLLQFLENVLPLAGFVLSFVGTVFRRSPITSIGGIRLGTYLMIAVLMGFVRRQLRFRFSDN
jgi:hypothetical protein